MKYQDFFLRKIKYKVSLIAILLGSLGVNLTYQHISRLQQQHRRRCSRSLHIYLKYKSQLRYAGKPTCLMSTYPFPYRSPVI